MLPNAVLGTHLGTHTRVSVKDLADLASTNDVFTRRHIQHSLEHYQIIVVMPQFTTVLQRLTHQGKT